MRFVERKRSRRFGRASAFTLVEVLAALLFMALVIPVAVEGLQVASRASVVGQRKAVAARIAERELNEQIVTMETGMGGAQSGVVHEGQVDYSWTVKVDMWDQSQNVTLLQINPMQTVTVQVNFPVQGSIYEVHLTTLMNALMQ